MTSPPAVLNGRTDLAEALPQLQGSSTLPSMLFDALEEAIITGLLAPGERIHADDLAAHYGVSRIPVREALRSLHEAGWVDIRPRYGVRVRERSETELRELFEFRALVEGRVAHWAAQRRTPAELDTLRAAVSAGQDAYQSGDHLRLAASHSAFYDVLSTAAHNAVLKTTSVGLRKRARFYFSTVEDQLGHDWIEVHQALSDAVAAGDARAATRIASHHIEATGTAVRDLLFRSR